MSVALRLQSSLLLLLLVVIYPSAASFAIITKTRNSNSNLLGLLVVGPNAKRAVRIDSTVLLLHGSGGEGDDDNSKDAVKEDLPRRRDLEKKEEEEKKIRFAYPIQDQVADTIGRFWNSFIRGVILVASIGIVLNLSGLAIDADEKGFQIDTIQHMRELKQFKAEYKNT